MSKLILQLVLGLVLIYAHLISNVKGNYFSSGDELGLFKNFLRTMGNNRRISQPKIITGQLNTRAARSEVGEMANALRLYQLQELDRMYGQKSRPRFGKRSGEDLPNYKSGYDTSSSLNMYDDEERR